MKYSFPSRGRPKLNPNSGQAEGLLAWYPVSKYDTAKQLVDYSGNGHTAVNSSTVNVAGTPRGIVADLTGNNTNHYIASVDMGVDFSLCVRYYGTANVNNGTIVSALNIGNTEYHEISADGAGDNLISAWSPVNLWLRSSITVSGTLNSWIDIVLVVNGTDDTIKLYVNGELEATDSVFTQLTSPPDRLLLGTSSNISGNFCRGYVKDVRAYDKALTDSEVFAYTNPATRYDLWAEEPASLFIPDAPGGAVQAPLPVVEGSIPIDGTGTGVALTTLPIAVGTGTYEPYGAIISPLPVAVGTGINGGAHVGTVTPGLPTVAGVGTAGRTGSADLAFRLPAVSGRLDAGQVIIGAVQIPLALVDATSGSTGSVQPSASVVAAIGLTGRAGIGEINAPIAQVIGVSSQEALIVGTVITSNPVVFGEVRQGALSIGDVQNRIATVSAVGVSGGISTGAAIAPLFNINATFISEGLSTGEVLLSLPAVHGTMLVTLTSSVTWVLNTENNKATNYTQFPFSALGHMGASSVGATVDGLYLLTGDSDNGQAIDSVFKFGMTDFRSELVENADVYVGGDMESDMEVSIREDGQEDGNTYLLSERERHVRGHHAKLGKGFRSRYREVSISNVNGGNFDLDSLSLSSRDLRGNE
jgi:hypothetical protein